MQKKIRSSVKIIRSQNGKFNCSVKFRLNSIFCVKKEALRGGFQKKQILKKMSINDKQTDYLAQIGTSQDQL